MSPSDSITRTAILTGMHEVAIEELIIRFDGTVVEVFYAGRGNSERLHIAHLEQIELLRLDSRRGPAWNVKAVHHGGFTVNNLKMRPDQVAPLQALLATINAAIPR